MFAKADLNARACGLRGLDKNELVFVRKDHRVVRRRRLCKLN
jgi:hypothetical protein